MSLLVAVLIITVGMAEEPASHPRADLIIDPTELLKPEIAKQFRILDARPKDQYDAGHISNAVWADHDDWSKTFAKDQGASRWQKLVGQLGITADTRVVIYDDHSTNRAARLWWILRYWGIRDVKLLNGGWKGWTAAHGPTTQEAPKIETVQAALSPHPERLATKAQLIKSLPKHDFQIIDARSESEYCGEANTAKRNGAISGALHKEWTEVIDKKTQRFKSPEDLTKTLQRSRN